MLNFLSFAGNRRQAECCGSFGAFFRSTCFAIRERFENADDKTTKSGHIGRSVADTNARTIFVEVPVDDVGSQSGRDPGVRRPHGQAQHVPGTATQWLPATGADCL